MKTLPRPKQKLINKKKFVKLAKEINYCGNKCLHCQPNDIVKDISISPETTSDWQQEWQRLCFDHEFDYIGDGIVFIQKVLDKALDRARIQHLATMSLLISDHRQELKEQEEKVYKDLLDLLKK